MEERREYQRAKNKTGESGERGQEGTPENKLMKQKFVPVFWVPVYSLSRQLCHVLSTLERSYH